jgi:hypothetical protein
VIHEVPGMQSWRGPTVPPVLGRALNLLRLLEFDLILFCPSIFFAVLYLDFHSVLSL